MFEQLTCTLFGHAELILEFKKEEKKPSAGKFPFNRCLSCLVCPRCGLEKSHSVLDHEALTRGKELKWLPDSSSPCKQVIRCPACKKLLKEKVNHVFEEHIDKCSVYLQCKICDEKQPKGYRHDWNTALETTITACHVKQKCTHCTQETDIYRHHFEEVIDKCSVYLICKVCGERQQTDDRHTFEFKERKVTHRQYDGVFYDKISICKVCGQQKVEFDAEYTDW